MDRMPKDRQNPEPSTPREVLGILLKNANPVPVERVVLELLRHERDTRPDIGASLGGVRLEGSSDQWLPTALQSPRGGLVRFLLAHKRWVECAIPPRAVPTLTVNSRIRWRTDLAPRTGTLRECAKTLTEVAASRQEFEACMEGWRARDVDTRGMSVVWGGGELSVVEGCHRLIGLAWLLQAQPEAAPSDDVPLFLGLRRTDAE